MALRDRGGISPEEEKQTVYSPIETMGAGERVILPLLQHRGDPAIPLVKAGDRVRKGQKIAEAAEGLSCPVHASVSGRVTDVCPVATPQGEGLAIVLENDFREEFSPEIAPFSGSLASAGTQGIVAFLKEKGIVDGAGFPVWKKVEEAVGRVECLIVDGTESEPYLTANHRILLEHAPEVLGGAKIIMAATEAKEAVFAAEESGMDAVEELFRLTEGEKGFSLTVLPARYPQGESLLVKAIRKREIPRNGSPLQAGVLVLNAAACRDVYRAFVFGLPVMERVVTVGGDCLRSPANVSVPLGVCFSELFVRCGGFLKRPHRILAGGPMMGKAQETEQVPVTKGESGVLALTVAPVTSEACMRCGRCMRACPMRLMPMEICRLLAENRLSEAERAGLVLCMECGACSWACPSKIPVARRLREGKEALSENQS